MTIEDLSPTLDLHPYCHDSGGDVTGALHATRLFLLGQLAAGSGEVQLIHGKGAGKLRDFVHALIEEYRQQGLVRDYHLLSGNTGVTIVKLPTGRKARELIKEDPVSLRTRPFEELKAQLRQQLKTPPVLAEGPAAPLPVIDGEARLGTVEFATLEEYARALVQQRTDEITPPSAAPRKLRKQSAQGTMGAKAIPTKEGWAVRDLDALAREARTLEALPPPKKLGR